jgi:sporulation protein YlmC with PRC-barrel domain
MNRFLITTAVGLFIGITPAIAQDQAPQDESMSPPAIQAPASPSDGPSVIDDRMSPTTEAPSPQSSEAPPQSITPPDKSALNEAPSAAGSDRFLSAQKSSDYLASNLIGLSVVNAKNEAIGDINDLVTDDNGKVVAVLVGAGGFLGLGEKDVAVPFEDLKIARDANNDLTVMLNVDQETIASAPDYQRLDEQQIMEGANKTDREDKDATRTY